MTLTAAREQSAACRFGPELTEVRRARETLRKALSDWGHGEHLDLAELILSELVTNAIRHGEGPVDVSMSCQGSCLHLTVHDYGPGRPVRRTVTAGEESGRGLEVVDGLLELQGGRRTLLPDPAGGGKTVRVALNLADQLANGNRLSGLSGD